MRQKVLTMGHQGHLGITKTKSLMREKVYFINECIVCQANTKVPNPTPLNMSELPKEPWVDISCDFFGPLASGDSLLVITGLYSQFPLVEVMKTTNAAAVINRFEMLFSIFGYPESIKYENGPPFNSSEFRYYLKSVNIRDAPTIPEHPESNAAVESFNRSLKKLVRTAKFN